MILFKELLLLLLGWKCGMLLAADNSESEVSNMSAKVLRGQL